MTTGSRDRANVSLIIIIIIEDEQADAGQDGRTRVAGPFFQARTGTEKYNFSLFVQLTHEQDWQLYPVDSYSATCRNHASDHNIA